MPDTATSVQPTLPAGTLDALSEPIVLVDRLGLVTLFNRAAHQAWPTLAAGRPLSFALRSPVVLEALEDVLAGASGRTVDYVERIPLDRVFELEVTAIGTAGEADAVALLAFRDLTAARRIEAMRADFVANASHELRTPLASLLGFIETLQGPARDDAATRMTFLGIMREQAQRMARLIDDLLSLSRVELREHRRPEGRVDIVAVVGQIADTLRPMAIEYAVEIRLKRPAEALLVTGDRDELSRLAENLIENALKYGASGQIVDVSVQRSEDGRMAVLAVRDYGPGIDRQHLPRLTERFYRADVAASRSIGGTGLGLAIVKHIVNRHRGRLSIESAPGEGALFTVAVPVETAD
jgi:two-component system, OmpR family, phosphate regulon sensor histidine kinase PhoR